MHDPTHVSSARLYEPPPDAALHMLAPSTERMALDTSPVDMSEEPTLRPVDERARLVAARISTESSQVERLPFDLSALESGGVFANVDASGFGLLDRRLDWRALGVALPRHGDFAFHPPRHGVVPDKYRLPLLRPAARVHAALHRYSYHFRLIEAVFETPAFRWLPWRAWPEFERCFETERARLDGALRTYAADHTLIREQALEAFGRLAADSALRLEATGQSVPPGFQDALVREVLGALPDPDELRRCLMLRYRIGVFHLGSEMLAEQRRAAEERRRLEAAQAEVRLELVRQDAERQLVQEQLWVERVRVRAQARAEDEDRRREAAIKERLSQLKLDAARERLQDTLSPLQEGARQLHATVFEDPWFPNGASTTRSRDLGAAGYPPETLTS
jgi:hypothetical protein